MGSSDNQGCRLHLSQEQFILRKTRFSLTCVSVVCALFYFFVLVLANASRLESSTGALRPTVVLYLFKDLEVKHIPGVDMTEYPFVKSQCISQHIISLKWTLLDQ